MLAELAIAQLPRMSPLQEEPKPRPEPNDGLILLLEAARAQGDLGKNGVFQPPLSAEKPKATVRAGPGEREKRKSVIITFSFRTGRLKARRVPAWRGARNAANDGENAGKKAEEVDGNEEDGLEE